MKINSSSRFLIAIGIIVFSSLTVFGSGNTDGNLEEATGLTEEKQNTQTVLPAAESSTSSLPWLSRGRTRSYLLIDGTQSSGSTDDQGYFPNGQFSFSGDYQIQNNTFITLDAIENYDAKSKTGSFFLNQVGFRSRWSETVQYFIGKERNRRSPGLIVSPSDFIFSNTNLPGQREDRKGVWLGRLSYQKISGSMDFFILPVQAETSDGLPQTKHNDIEAALRGLYQFTSIDVSLLIGRYQSMSHAGISVQTLLDNKYKIYLELGTQDEVSFYNNTKKEHPLQSLLGFGYEGSEDFSVRLEYFENGQGLNSDDFNQMMRLRVLFPSQFIANANLQLPFVRQKYLIASLSAPEINKKYNLTISGIKSLEDDSILSISRLEYISGDNILMGFSFTQIQGGVGSQFQYRNFNSQTTVDLKYSF